MNVYFNDNIRKKIDKKNTCKIMLCSEKRKSNLPMPKCNLYMYLRAFILCTYNEHVTL